MATQAQAVSDVAQTLDNEYQQLCDMMADISDGTLDGVNGDDYVGHNLGGKHYGYEIGGQKFDLGYFDAQNDFHHTGKDATLPGTMLQISTATSQQAVFTGQLTDTAMKAAQLQKAVSQKVG
ncbi:hypothetical protein A2311_01535 [candidate division WOR-1 bacterium RIFOXYB2_FULL_48_7]|uniref:Uncharacterized protein n=1 Tax=candidate division WOR-1 bacterium RIFOXYB2_FULL_48_7 TaxID=1802583 RepID=A0A1F4TRL3_UNCSA|nr:MAG: hypothetical protein A2311_01535 [candidate division WOR-1 bacterium RIFOXYB2_FULL_48_7]